MQKEKNMNDKYEWYIISPDGITIRLSKKYRNPSFKENSAILSIMFNIKIVTQIKRVWENEYFHRGDSYIMPNVPDFIILNNWDGKFIDGDKELESCSQMCCNIQGDEDYYRTIYIPSEYDRKVITAILNYVGLTESKSEYDANYYRFGKVGVHCNLVSWSPVNTNNVDA